MNGTECLVQLLLSLKALYNGDHGAREIAIIHCEDLVEFLRSGSSPPSVAIALARYKKRLALKSDES